MKPHSFVTILTLSLLSLTSCLTDQENRPVTVGSESFEVKVSSLILGDDDRKLVPEGHVDNSTVAIVRGADKTVCTGTTIGLSQVLTAAHCLYDTRTGKLKTGLTVIPGLHLAKGFIGGSRYFISRVYILKDYIEEIGFNGFSGYASSKDIAVLQVKEYQGNTFFSEQSPKIELGNPRDFRLNGHKLDMIAYHSAQTAKASSQYFINECYTTGRSFNYTAVKHDCDITKGTSGAGIISERKVYGVHSAENSNRGVNLAALITEFLIPDLEKIKLFKTDGLTRFKVFEMNPDTYNTVSIQNNCTGDIEFSVAYSDLEGDKRATNPTSVKANSIQLLPLKTTSDEVHVYGKRSDNTRVWDGDHTLRLGTGQVFNYMTVDLKNHRGNTNLKFNCN